MLLGYASGYKGIRVFNIETKKILTVAKLVKVSETVFPALDAAAAVNTGPCNVVDDIMDQTRDPPSSQENEYQLSQASHPNEQPYTGNDGLQQRVSPRLLEKRIRSTQDSTPPPPKRLKPNPPAIMVTAPTSSPTTHEDLELLDYIQRTKSLSQSKLDLESNLSRLYHALSEIASEESSFTPRSYKQAMPCPVSDLCKTSHQKEVDSLISKGTFEFVHTLPPNKKALSNEAGLQDQTCKGRTADIQD
jgi:hypothetical protein